MCNPKVFLRRFVTVDETWIHWYTPETKEQSKQSLAGQKFSSNEEVVAATEAYFADLEKTYFSDELKKYEHRWVKCIELKGDYVEQ